MATLCEDTAIIMRQGYVDNKQPEAGTQNISHKEMLDIINQGSYFSYSVRITLIIINACLILIGVCGNGLVCFVVARNASMRTPRNIFIINLAISDLSLSLFTEPFNLIKLLCQNWIFGDFMCKVVSMFQGTNVFVSTISITAIALDRFQVIVYPTKDSMKKIGAVVALLSIWVISLLISSPLLVFTYLHVAEIAMSNYQIFLYRCIEDGAMKSARGAYSIASLVVQYLLPIIIVSIAHARICNKLKCRMTTTQLETTTSAYQSSRKARDRRRKQRTNTLLAMIAVVFVLSWLPLNICNILIEFIPEVFQDRNVSLVFVICHMLVLSSACTNPILYGWLNDNFRIEFVKVLVSIWALLTCRHCRRRRESFGRRTRRQTQNIPMIVLTTDGANH